MLWRNVQGAHTVDDSTATYPSNPVSFGGGRGAGAWTYSFTFDVPGSYTYECGIHGSIMTGTITVNPGTGTGEDPAATFRLSTPSPNPFRGATEVTLEVTRAQTLRATVLDALGRQVALLHHRPVAPEAPLRLRWAPREELAMGVYLLLLEGETFGATRELTLAR